MLDRQWALGLVAGLAVACGSVSNLPGPDAATCTQGDTRSCVGPGACQGAQACGGDGTWSQCDCGGGGQAGSGGSTSLDGGPDTSPGGSGGSGGACTGTTFVGKAPLDMYIMMDKSGSMTTNSKWQAVTAALTNFVNSGAPVAGIGVGLQFFPLDTSTAYCPPFSPPPCATGCIDSNGVCVPDTSAECDVNTYLPPAVSISLLPGVAQHIINAMNSQTPGGGTPTLPALTSAEQATQAYAAANPQHRVVIVLVTDGQPTDCNSTVANVAAEAATGLKASPPVMTFVVGIGTSLTNLDTIAQAGGTTKAYIVDGNANTTQQFFDALNKVRSSAPGCSYGLPTNAGTIDPSMVNILYTPPGGSSTTLPEVQGAAQCGSGAGWYYDDPTHPTLVTLCPASCATVKNGTNQIDIQLGCPTNK